MVLVLLLILLLVIVLLVLLYKLCMAILLKYKIKDIFRYFRILLAKSIQLLKLQDLKICIIRMTISNL